MSMLQINQIYTSHVSVHNMKGIFLHIMNEEEEEEKKLRRNTQVFHVELVRLNLNQSEIMARLGLGLTLSIGAGLACSESGNTKLAGTRSK